VRSGLVNCWGKEEKGSEKPDPLCVFSGLNDNPGSTDPENPGGIVQSYGFSVVSKGLKAFAPSPGDTFEDGGCRGGSNPDNPPSP
jgi:hypothetical protein